MAPKTCFVVPVESGLYCETKCHTNRPVLVLMFFASVLVSWLEAVKLTVGLHAPWNISHPFSVQRLGAGLQIAIDKLNSEPGGLGNFSWTLTYTNSACSAKDSLAVFISQVQREQISAVFGPTCPEAAEVIGLLASEWNIPTFDYVGQLAISEKHFLYDTGVTLVPPKREMGDVLRKTLQYLGWERIGILGGCSRASSWDGVDEMWRVVEDELRYHFTITASMRHTRGIPALLQKDLRNIASAARVIILICSSDDAKRILLAAENLGLDAGEVVFILLQQLEDGFWKELLTRGKATHFPKAFGSVLLIALSSYGEGTGDDEFWKHVYQRLRSPPFHSSISSEEQANPYSAYLHGALLLYAQAVEEMMKTGRDFRDWRQLVNSLRANRTALQGITGPVFVDAQGERHMDYSVYALQPAGNGSLFLPFLHFDSFRKVIRPLRNFSNITWLCGFLPEDRPGCGFHNEFCTNETALTGTTVVILTMPLLILALGAAITSLVLRLQKGKSQSYRKELWWQTNHDDIIILPPSKGNLVALRYVSDQAVAWVRRPTVLQHVRLMCELKHENIVPFFGMCTEPPHICTVSQYCKKGSLKDILRNSDHEMDWIFKLSFAYDIVNGMLFLHGSPLGSHGNLKPSNCLVDGRMQVKLSGFGLWELRNGCTCRTYNEDTPDYSALLRFPQLPWSGTPKGDVYSFAILMRDLIHQQASGPFEDLKGTPHEIINRIRDPAPLVPLPPSLSEEKGSDKVVVLVRACWDETPEERPTFLAIRKTLQEASPRGRVSGRRSFLTAPQVFEG